MQLPSHPNGFFKREQVSLSHNWDCGSRRKSYRRTDAGRIRSRNRISHAVFGGANNTRRYHCFTRFGAAMARDASIRAQFQGELTRWPADMGKPRRPAKFLCIIAVVLGLHVTVIGLLLATSRVLSLRTKPQSLEIGLINTASRCARK